MTNPMSDASSPAQLFQKASGKFTPILQQWLAIKAAVAVLVCALFLFYYGHQAATAPEGLRSGIGAAMALIGLVSSLQSVWSLWGRRRVPPLPFAILSAAASPLMITYWVWTAFVGG